MGLTDDPKGDLVSRLSELVKEISALPECKNIFKRMYGNLARRIKLLSPLFEELGDIDKERGPDEIRGFELLMVALDSAKELLKACNEGSKLYQVFYSLFQSYKQRENYSSEFSLVVFMLFLSLNNLPFKVFLSLLSFTNSFYYMDTIESCCMLFHNLICCLFFKFFLRFCNRVN